MYISAQFEAVKKTYILPTICLKTILLKFLASISYQIFRENKEFSHCLKIANCISRVTERPSKDKSFWVWTNSEVAF